MPYDYTQVTTAKSQEQIKKLLAEHGVTIVRITSFPSTAVLEFIKKVGAEQHVPYRISLRPNVRRDVNAALWDRSERQVWRVAYWWLKAKLEAVKFGLVEFEQEMLPYMLVSGAGGPPKTVATYFFESVANRLTTGDDPFSGLRLALREGTNKEEEK